MSKFRATMALSKQPGGDAPLRKWKLRELTERIRRTPCALQSRYLLFLSDSPEPSLRRTLFIKRGQTAKRKLSQFRKRQTAVRNKTLLSVELPPITDSAGSQSVRRELLAAQPPAGEEGVQKPSRRANLDQLSREKVLRLQKLIRVASRNGFRWAIRRQISKRVLSENGFQDEIGLRPEDRDSILF